MEYITIVFQEGAMGLRASERRDTDWILGNTVLSDFGEFGANSQARKQGARALDVFVGVNGEYVAFLPHEAVLSRLKSGARPLTVVFARPKREAWMRVVNEPDGIIRAGELAKMTGITRLTLSRWQDREFILTRNSIAYAEDGTLRKKIGLEDVVRIQQFASGVSGPDRDTSFSLITVEREFVLKGKTAMEKLEWMHAIDVAQNRAFDASLNYDALFAESNELTTESQRTPPGPSPRNSTLSPPPSLERKISVKRAPPPVPTQSSSTNHVKTTPKTSSFRQAMRLQESGPYWMLAETRVVVDSGGSVGGMPNLQLPPPPASVTAVYDFKLEQSVLQRGR